MSKGTLIPMHDLIRSLQYQLAIGIHTRGPCATESCGNSSRGSKCCALCVVKDMLEILQGPLRSQFEMAETAANTDDHGYPLTRELEHNGNGSITFKENNLLDRLDRIIRLFKREKAMLDQVIFSIPGQPANKLTLGDLCELHRRASGGRWE